ncbi:MAG: Cysteine protease atg4 [Candelaria pacifica]|nr:MAG: Cysteine protease atg4 [Candelaria pacifica]
MSNTVEIPRYKRIVQYFWDPEPRNDDTNNSPIWCLGRQYNGESDLASSTVGGGGSLRDGSPTELAQSSSLAAKRDKNGGLTEGLAYNETLGGAGEKRSWPSPFLDDIESRIWLTYRSNFPPIPKLRDETSSSAMTFAVRLRSQLIDQGGFSSDAGWGCMIRSGQCLLANALLIVRLGRDWRRGQCESEERHLLSMFADDPRAPFSIHRFVEHGASACGKHPGEWFGPSATAGCIQALADANHDTGLRVYITGDGSDVYENRFMEAATSGDGVFHPTLVLVGIRLGIDRITPVYWEALRASLQLPQSIGIAGGRPSSSHYFIGVQDSSFFYLDPHHTRPALPLPDDIQGYTAEDIASCHTRRLRRIHVKEMDPSMLIAFLIRDAEDWKTWRQSVSRIQGKSVIHVADIGPALHGLGSERESAIDEVESVDEDEDDDDDDLRIVGDT